MKVIAALDSFKGSMTSLEAGQAVIKGVQKYSTEIETEVISVADGGEGSVEAVYQQLGGKWQEIETIDLTFEPVKARYLVLEEPRPVVLIEAAEVLAISKIKPSPETIRTTSSYGLGEMIRKISQESDKEIILFLGGTGTSDGGVGFLQGLTGKKTSAGQNPLLLGDRPGIPEIKTPLTVATDVTNPFIGEKGAVNVFAQQKGADPQQLKELEEQMINLNQFWVKETSVDLSKTAGAGAAGGIGGAAYLVGKKLASGFDVIADLINLKEKLNAADLIYTGEGKMDAQTLDGKLPQRIAECGKKSKTPVVALVGSYLFADLVDNDFAGIFSIVPYPMTLEKAMEKIQAQQNLTVTAYETFRLFERMQKNHEDS